MTRGALLVGLRRAGVAAALVLMVWTARSAWRELSANPVPLDRTRVLLALALLAAAYLGFVALWREVLATLGVRPSYRGTLRLWAFSNLGRYLPGKIWQVAGVAAFARDLGVRPAVATAAALLAMGLTVGTGALISLALVPGVVRALGPAAVLVPVAAAGPLVLLARPDLMARGLRALPASLGLESVPVPGRGQMARLIGLFVAGWAAHGVTFVVFSSAFPSGAEPSPWTLGAIYVLAYVGGLVAFFAPGGIGVREGLLAHLLSSVCPEAFPVHVVAVGTRLWSMAAEGIVLLGAVSAGRAR